MKTDVVDPVAAGVVPAVDSLPLVEAAVVETGRRRWKGTLESIVFYGVLAFGLLFPVVGTIYAKMFL